MTKILQVVSSLKKNGTETFIINTFREINRNEFMFDFLIFNDTKDGFYEEVCSYGSKVYYIPSRKKNPILYEKNLNKFFSEHKGEYDAIHMNDMSLTTLAPLRYAKKYGVPVRIMHMHSSNCQGLHNKILHRINKHFIRNVATHYLGCSMSALEWGYSKTKIKDKSLVINNGIDLSRFRFDNTLRNKIRKDLKITSEERVLIHIGSFNTVKNHSFLLDIFKEAREVQNDLKLLLAGDGPLLEEMKEKARNLGINKDVFFLGRKENIPDLLSAADCLILPSLHEGLPMVLIEAQASGLPVVVSTGVSDEARVSQYFRRIGLNDKTEIWINSIFEFLKYNNDREDLSNEIKKYSVKNTVKQLEEIYNSK